MVIGEEMDMDITSFHKIMKASTELVVAFSNRKLQALHYTRQTWCTIFSILKVVDRKSNVAVDFHESDPKIDHKGL